MFDFLQMIPPKHRRWLYFLASAVMLGFTVNEMFTGDPLRAVIYVCTGITTTIASANVKKPEDE